MGPVGRLGAAWSMRARGGRPKAMVLPEPVGALPQTSRPARASGRVAAWTGKGEAMPSSSRRAQRAAGTPRSAKVGDTVGGFSWIEWSGDARTLDQRDQQIGRAHV